MSRRRLGEILLEHGWITRADLARALKAQQLVGGRLGTCLLEGESLSEELLAQALGEQLGLPPAPIEDLRRVDPEVLELLPKRLAVRCRAVPLRAAGSRLDIATSEPGNLGCQDEIAFATSRRVVVHVASEARIVEALARSYGEQPAGRFVGLLDRLNRQRYLWTGEGGGEAEASAGELLGPIDGGAEAAAPAGRAAARAAAPNPSAEKDRGEGAGGGEVAAAPPAARAAAGAGNAGDAAKPSGAGMAASRATPGAGGAGAAAAGDAGAAAPAELPATSAPRARRPSAVELSEGERATLLGAAGAAPPPARPTPVPRRDPTTLAAAVAQLDEAAERDEVGRILLAFLRQFFDRVLLLAAKSDGVHGWLGAGDGVDRERLADLAIPFDRPSVFLNLRQGSGLHLGTLPPMPAHRPLLAVLGGDPPGPCVMLPVRLGGRLAAVIYGDRDGGPVGGVDLDGLRRLADQASLALERCISLKRKAHSGPAAG
jgi:hypothetical protein